MSRVKKWFSAEALREIVRQFAGLHRRFPLTMLCSLLATVFLVLYVRAEGRQYTSIDGYRQMHWSYMQFFLTFLLAVPLLFSAEVLSESVSGMYKKLLIKTVPIGVLILFFFSNPLSQIEDQTFLIRFAVLFVAFHLLVAFAPFWNSPHSNGFWQYNKTLFLRILTAFLYSFTLSAGLSLAILAVEKLFGFNVSSRTYTYLWIVINGYVNTAFFLAGIPKNIPSLEQSFDYPKGLKVFTQFVLLPLIGIYLIILYAYEGKILLAWDLPKGWVSNLVLLSAVAGILAFLLLHPLKQTTDWVRRFNKAYYVALVPLVGLLFVAIYVRINEYGVTEPRYFVATLAVWLLGIVLYFLFSRADNIKIIPISLFVLCMLSIVGPWGAFSVSDRSQLNRLYRVLETNKWLKNGKISIPDTAINGPDLGEVDATLFYFADRQSYLKLQPLFTQSLDSLRNKSTYDRRYQLANWSNLTVVRPEASQSARYFYSISGENGEINISGYDYMLKGYHPVYAQSAAADTTQRKVSVSWQDSTQSLVIRLNSKTLLMSMTRRIGEMAVLETSVVPDEKMQLEAENDQLKAKLLMENVNIDPQRKHLQSMNYKLLVKEK